MPVASCTFALHRDFFSFLHFCCFWPTLPLQSWREPSQIRSAAFAPGCSRLVCFWLSLVLLCCHGANLSCLHQLLVIVLIRLTLFLQYVGRVVRVFGLAFTFSLARGMWLGPWFFAADSYLIVLFCELLNITLLIEYGRVIVTGRH